VVRENMKLSLKSILFWVGALVITTTVIIVTVIIIVANPRVKSLDNIITLNNTTVLSAESDSSYYVYFYSASDKSEKQLRLQNTILEYATTVKRNKNNSNALNIYLFNTDAYPEVLSKDVVTTAMANKLDYSGIKINPIDMSLVVKITSGRIGSVIYINEIKIAEEFAARIKLIVG
jgi:hypothetical protein